MTQMQQAITEAGIAIPLIKRAWLYIKDYPGSTSRDIEAGLKLPASSGLSSALFDLRRRSMVEAKEELRRRNGGGRGAAHFVERAVMVYTVNPRMHGEYELWPAPKALKAAPQPAPAVTKREEPAARPAPQEFDPATFVAGLSLAQCKELFKFLRDQFTI